MLQAEHFRLLKKQVLHFLRGTGKRKQHSREKMLMKGIVLCA